MRNKKVSSSVTRSIYEDLLQLTITNMQNLHNSAMVDAEEIEKSASVLEVAVAVECTNSCSEDKQAQPMLEPADVKTLPASCKRFYSQYSSDTVAPADIQKSDYVAMDDTLSTSEQVKAKCEHSDAASSNNDKWDRNENLTAQHHSRIGSVSNLGIVYFKSIVQFTLLLMHIC